MKCFVTGAAGFIGSALTRRLVSEGHFVICLIHQTPPIKILRNVRYIYGDITKKESFSPHIQDADIIFHCAGYVNDYGSRKKFYDINVKGTRNLTEALNLRNLKQFFFFGHLPYESSSPNSPYSQSKHMAEVFLQKLHKDTGFPVTIIHPGNVYGPGKSTWVIRPVEAICKNRMLLIDGGKGIFLHTYIDNLLDGLILCVNKPNTIGKTILITDGDNSITWHTYFNDLAAIIGKKPITKSISKHTARLIARLILGIFPLFGVSPWITPLAVDIFTNTKYYDLTDTLELIEYTPKISYPKAMEKIEIWVKEHIIG